MQRMYWPLLAGVLGLLLFPPGMIRAESVRSLVETGNRAYEQGDYAESMEIYEKAVQAAPDSAVALFNRGNALYKLGRYGEAFNAYEQAAAMAMKENDPGLEAKSRYNMGNTAFRRAEALGSENPAAALEELNRSGEYFQSAIRLDPTLLEAVHNLEIARMTAKQVEELLRKRQQQQQTQQISKEQMTKELEELSRQQQEAARQSQEEAEAGKRFRKSEDEQDQRLEQLAENQQELRDRTGQLDNRLERSDKGSDGQTPAEMTREHLKRALENQEKARQNLERRMPEEASEAQEAAAAELQKALQQMNEEPDEESGRQQARREGPDANGHEKPENLPRDDKQAEEQDQVAAASPEKQDGPGESPADIINEELEYRKIRRSGGASGYVPVERDW